MPAEIRPVSGRWLHPSCVVWPSTYGRVVPPPLREYKQLLAPCHMGTGLMQVSPEACRATSSCSHQISVCSTAARLLQNRTGYPTVRLSLQATTIEPDRAPHPVGAHSTRR